MIYSLTIIILHINIRDFGAIYDLSKIYKYSKVLNKEEIININIYTFILIF